MIFRKIIPNIVYFFLFTSLSAQTASIDSLKQLLSSFNDNGYEKGKL